MAQGGKTRFQLTIETTPKNLIACWQALYSFPDSMLGFIHTARIDRDLHIAFIEIDMGTDTRSDEHRSPKALRKRLYALIEVGLAISWSVAGREADGNVFPVEFAPAIEDEDAIV